MGINNKEKTIKNAVGVAGGAVLLAPVGIPILHGLFGVAVVGLDLFAAGSLVAKSVNALTGLYNRQAKSIGAY